MWYLGLFSQREDPVPPPNLGIPVQWKLSGYLADLASWRWGGGNPNSYPWNPTSLLWIGGRFKNTD